MFSLSIYLSDFQNEDPPISRICYNSMKHIEGDVVKPRDCIVLASGHRKRDLPFIAKVTSLWENPEDGKSIQPIFHSLMQINFYWLNMILLYD